ncbi:MAG: sulfatase family protein, partial [Planctomycetota bacterium]
GFDWGWWPENLQDPSASLGFLAGDDLRMIEPAFAWAEAGPQPFLLMMITSVAHDPYEVPSCYGQATGDRFSYYLQTIRYTDDFLGEVCRQLEERGLSDNTVLCVLGDHGESFRPDSRRGRWVPYEEVLRVPWIIHWPGRVQPGQRLDWPCSQLDVTPTLLKLIGFDVSQAGFEGKDAMTPSDPHRRLYFDSWYSKSPRGFIEGSRKVVYWPYLDKVVEFDLQVDPAEQAPQLVEGAPKDSIIDNLYRWRQDSRLYFDAKRFRQRLVFDHWHTFCSGRSAWAYYVP